MVYYGREHEEENRRKKRTRQKTEAPTMAVRSALKQPEKNTQRNPGGKGWIWYYCGKEGHLKQNCPQTSKLPLAPGPVCEGPYGEDTVPCGIGPQRRDFQNNQD